MLAYVVKRVLLMVPTLLGILLITFAVMQFVPGGPVEQLLQELRGRGQAGEVASSDNTYRGRQGVDPAKIEEIRKLYGFDQPAHVRFREMLERFARFDLGTSYFHHKSVWELVKEKLPVSISLGLWTFFISYLVSIPLGIAKAVRHGSRFDFFTSVIVFLGYAVPGWALGTALLVLFGGGSFWELFPLGGFRPDNWEYLSTWGKITGQLHHMALPVFCYMVGAFATETILTKNSLMENLGQDYVRTAFAKGLSERRVIFVHALRNSLIPLVTGLGHAISLILAGSFLIERVFNIDGMGYLGYTAILQRDYPVALGILVIGSLLMLVGNILSDIIYALVDPRIRFQ
jgi:microcin C transport system permease protein